jgi:hypothetical protein
VNSHPDLSLCREASNCSGLHPSGHFSSLSERSSVFDQASGFLAKHRYGKNDTTVRTMWILVRMHSSIRPNANRHGPDARASDMEIGCIRSAVRTTVPPIWTRKDFIWKLLAADMRPSRRQGITVRTWLSNKKDLQLNFLEFWLHSCPSGRPMTTVRMAPSFIKPDTHLNC